MHLLAEALQARKLVSGGDLGRAEQVRARTGDRLAATLARLGLVSEEDIASALGDILQLDRVPRGALSLPADLPPDLNPRFLKRRSIVPIATDDAAGPNVAMADPGDLDALAALRFATGMDLRPAIAAFSDIDDVLSTATEYEGLEAVGADYDDAADDDIERLLEEASDAPAIRIVQTLLARAATRGASDVHVEPMARHLQIRYRIDGQLIEAERLPDSFAAPIASRIKILASLDIAETRLPQDGRLRLAVRGHEIDVRVSTSPTAWGESIVLRLLGRNAVPLDLNA